MDTVGLAEWFRRRSLRAPNLPALTFEGETLSYGDLETQIERLATVLAGGGVQPGDRVSYLGFNHPLLVVTLFASARLGAIFVPLNFRFTSLELKYVLDDAGSHTIVVDADHRARIDAVRGTLACRRYLSLGDGGEAWENLESCLRDVVSPVRATPVAADDVATILYTSGTTGKPKGAMLTHRNLWANNTNFMLTVNYNATEVALTSAPLFHSGGLCVMMLPTLMAGGHVILQKHFEPQAFLAAVERHRATAVFAVPAMMLFASQHPDFATTDLSSLRIIVAGGAPVPESLLRIYAGRNVPVSQCWGLTETSTCATFLNPDEAIVRLGSCGKAGMLNDVRLVDFEGNPFDAPNVKGELCVRGATVMKGYWNLPEATAAALGEDGWIRTGDVAYRDADGYYYICDRLKDMIITGGENVYPAEVEGALYEHAAIAEVAVIGAADEQWGEHVVAVVALKPGASLRLEELRAFGAERLARYKLPRQLRFVSSLPRNTAGKVDKPSLRKVVVD